MTDDKKIIGGIRNGDIKIYEELFRTTYSSLVNYAITILKDKDTAEEIVQDLFYKLWRDRNKIKINTSINGYLFRAVYNKCMHYIDHQNVVKKHMRDAKKSVSIDKHDPSKEMNYKELNEKIAIILGKLPERCARIFCMNRFEGLKYSDIAKELSISIKTVEANMSKALREFRNELL